MAASYFFKRGDEGRNDATRLFPTIASQLADKIPSFKACLKQSLGGLGKDAILKRALEFQFKTLISNPLGNATASEPGNRTWIIVVDALDECEQPGHVSQILNLFSCLRECPTTCLRVFLTSRSTNLVNAAFEDLQVNDIAHRSLALHEDYYDETKADISAYLRVTFTTIKARRKIKKVPWPDPEDMDRLITLATTPSPLFIYASTLCRFVDDEKGRKPPMLQLNRWLKQCDSHASQLNQIYLPILEDLFGIPEHGSSSDPLDSEDASEAMQILGSVVLVAFPLSARALAGLLDMDEDNINHWLRNFHAVLHVPTDPQAPVQLLHKSFSDFLLGQEGTGIETFRVNAADTHSMLASRCIQRMTRALHKDICDIGDPGKSMDEIDRGTVASKLPLDLEYACLYWSYHLHQSGRPIRDGDGVQSFLYTHLLHWLETLSLLGKLSHGILAVRSLLEILQVCKILDVIIYKHQTESSSSRPTPRLDLLDSCGMLRDSS